MNFSVRWHASIVALAILLLANHASAAQAGDKLGQAPHRAVFGTAFGDLARQGKVAIVAEEEPFKATLNAVETKKLSDRLAKAGNAFDTVVSEVASAYGYTARRLNTTVILLTKRYEQPGDIPIVPLGETIHALRSQLRLFTPLDATSGAPVSPAATLWSSFTPQDYPALTKGISLDKLDDRQQELLIQWATSGYGTKVTTIHELLRHLEALQLNSAVFRRIPFQGRENIPVLTCVGAFGQDGTERQLGMSHNVWGRLDGENIVMTGPDSHIVFASVSPSTRPFSAQQQKFVDDVLGSRMSDLTSPTKEDLARAPRPWYSDTHTLRDFLKTLHTEDSTKKVTFDAVADSPLDEKLITVFGQGFATSRNLLDAVAALYDLVVSDEKQPTYRITFPDLPRARTLVDLFRVQYEVFPAPYRRVLEARGEAARKQRPQVEAEKPPLARPLRGEQAALLDNTVTRGQLNSEAYRRLRALLEPLLPPESRNALRINDCGTEVPATLSFLRVMERLNYLDFRERVPDVLQDLSQDFSQIQLKMRLDEMGKPVQLCIYRGSVLVEFFRVPK